MERIIRQVAFPATEQPRLKRVAAYTRVSSGKDAMLHSLSAQVSFYSDYIQNHIGWLYCGVYSDEAITGTKDDRPGFQQMMCECQAGHIDLVLTKSISRFARNTVILLQTVRELKSLGVDVFFEEQNIHTMSADGELMMTILASYAQEESRSASENQKWRIKRNFESGKPWNCTMLGYVNDNGTLIVVPEEAAIVKRIFETYNSGKGLVAIAKELNADGIVTRRGNSWSKTSVMSILKNYAYTGNLLLQTSYRKDHLSKKELVNNGELPMFHVADSHEAIIPLEQFEATQLMIAEKAVIQRVFYERQTGPSTFSGLLVCATCGKNYRRKKAHGKTAWICATYATMGKAHCKSKVIPEDVLIARCCQVLDLEEFDPTFFRDRIEKIQVANSTLTFIFKNGTVQTTHWDNLSRSKSWTPEMREAARQKALLQRRLNPCQ